MALKNGNKSGRGGRREGAGRKPKAITLLKRKLIEDGKEDAEYAYSLFVSIMKDERIDVGLRKDAAREVLDRVLGKAIQSNVLTGKDGGPIQIFDYAAIDRLITRRPESDPSESGTN